MAKSGKIQQNLKECFKKLYLKEQLYDVTFKFNDPNDGYYDDDDYYEPDLKAHSVVLATRNAYFKEKILQNAREFYMKDFYHKDFQVFLKYLYTYQINDSEISADLFKIACKYSQIELEHYCKGKLQDYLDTKGAINILSIGLVYCQHNDLIAIALKYIARNLQDIMQSRTYDIKNSSPEVKKTIFLYIENILNVE